MRIGTVLCKNMLNFRQKWPAKYAASTSGCELVTSRGDRGNRRGAAAGRRASRGFKRRKLHVPLKAADKRIYAQ